MLVNCVSVLVPAQHYEMMVWYSSDSLLPAPSSQHPAAKLLAQAGKLPLSLAAAPQSKLSVTKVARKTQSVRLRVEYSGGGGLSGLEVAMSL